MTADIYKQRICRKTMQNTLDFEKIPFDKGSSAMSFEIKEIKRQSRAVKVTHPPAGGGNFTSGAASQVQWSDSVMKRLHPPSPKAMAGQASKTSRNWWRCEENLRFWVKSFCDCRWCGKTQKAWREALRLRSPFLPQAKMVEVVLILRNKSPKLKIFAYNSILLNILYSSENISKSTTNRECAFNLTN